MNGVPIVGRGVDVGTFVLVFDGAQWWLGRAVHDDAATRLVRLDPAYAYVAVWGFSPNGAAAGRSKSIVPVEWMASARVVETVWRTRIDVSDWSDDDRTALAKAVADAEELRAAMRAKRAGIELARG